MKRILSVSLLMLFQASVANAQDEIRYYDKAKKAEATVKATILDETPAGIKYKVGARTDTVALADLRDVTYQPPASVNRLDYRKPGNKEDEARKAALAGADDKRQKAVDEAVAGYKELLPKLADKPSVQTQAEFRLAALLAWESEYDPAKLDPAIAALKQFAQAHVKSWQITECMKTLAQLQEKKGDVAGATKTYEALAQVPGIPAAVKQDCDLLAVRALVDKNKPAAAAKLKELRTALAGRDAADPQKLKVEVYLAGLSTDPTQATKQLDAVINAAADNDVKALAYNTFGDLYRSQGTPEALENAFWKYLWVDVLYYQDKTEHARALYHLSKLFEQVKKDDVRAKECRNRLKEKEFNGLDYQQRVLREEK